MAVGALDLPELTEGTALTELGLACFHTGCNRRIPRTRLTAAKKYTAPKMGHQRSPALSIQPNRVIHPGDCTEGK